MVPYLDAHLAIFLLDFLRDTGVYSQKDISRAKIRAVEKTNMITVVEDEYEQYKSDAEMQAEYSQKKSDFEKRSQDIFSLLDNKPEGVDKVLTFFEDKDNVTALNENKQLTLDHLTSIGAFNGDDLAAFFRYAKFKYECGFYGEAQTMLGQYMMIQQGNSSATQAALWGKVAADVLQGLWMNRMQKDSNASEEDRANAASTSPRQWQLAVNDFVLMKESLDFRSMAHSDQVRLRAWVLHWALFVFFNQRENIDQLVDLFLERPYLQTMENLCPWLLRYYAVALILSPSRRKNAIREILQEINLLSYLYSDPITQFIDSLYDAFDFDIAQQKLAECQKLLQSDFFLHSHVDRFMHEARMLICEMYCTVHSSVDLVMLASKLQLTEAEAEKWMVDLVHNSSSATLQDAKIDSFGKKVFLFPPSKSIHHKITESTKDLTSRSAVLAANLEMVARDQNTYLHAK
jgi:translation initiation factor 3 subunit E